MVLLAVSTFSGVLFHLTSRPGTQIAGMSSGQTSGAATTAPRPSQTASPSPPKPKPKPAPTPQAPAKGYGLSVGNTLPGLSQAELARRLDAFKSMGVSWIRLDLDWNDVQPEGAGSHHWQNFDGVVSAATSRGLKLLPIITYTAPWARLSACSGDPKCAPASPAQYATFAHEAVKRYAPRGIHHWELWNEPNTDGAWLPKANVGAYVQLIKAAYPRIKQADPSAFVVSGGLASSGHTDGIPQLDYLAAIYAGGGGKYFDAVGYHPYSFPVPASYNVHWNAWSKMAGTSPSFRSIMSAHGDAHKQIWATEYGAPTGGPGPLATSANGYNIEGSPDHVDEALQAKIATDVVTASRNVSWLGPLFWYSYLDEGTTNDTVENFFGLLRADGSRKPAYNAFVQAINR